MHILSDEDSNTEVQIAQISCEASDTIDTLLQEEPRATDCCNDAFSDEQFKDPELQLMIRYLKEGEDPKLAKKVVTESVMYAIVNDVLYYVGPKQTETSRVAVPQQMRRRIMQEYLDGWLAGHFSVPKFYKPLVQSWWWPRMYSDALEYANNCSQCAIVQGAGRRQKPPLHPILTERPFQIVGVDIMELPITSRGNRYVIVFQDLFMKWPHARPKSNLNSSVVGRRS